MLLLLGSLAGCGSETEVRTSSPAPSPADSAPPTVEPDASTPALSGTPPEVRLVVPPRFDEALAAGTGGFATLASSDFGPEILGGTGGWSYPWSWLEAPFAVLADFDGNGKRDVALLQRSANEGRAVTVLDVSPRPRVLELRRWNRADAGDNGALSPFYLRLRPAGPMRVPDLAGAGADTTVTLRHEGVEVVAYGQAARTYWYSNGDFVSLTTAD